MIGLPERPPGQLLVTPAVGTYHHAGEGGHREREAMTETEVTLKDLIKRYTISIDHTLAR